MLVHVKISEGVPAALWLSTCGHLAPTLSTVGTVRSCTRCEKTWCIEVAHAVRDPEALNHHVELAVIGEMLQAGAPLTMSGILTRSPLETRCSPELLAALQDLGDLATNEITAYLTAGRAVDGCTLVIEDDVDGGY